MYYNGKKILTIATGKSGGGTDIDTSLFVTRPDATKGVGGVIQPVYVDANGKVVMATQYAGGTRVQLNGSNASTYGGKNITIYAPTTYGEKGKVLQANGFGSAPTWVDASGGASWELVYNGDTDIYGFEDNGTYLYLVILEDASGNTNGTEVIFSNADLQVAYYIYGYEYDDLYENPYLIKKIKVLDQMLEISFWAEMYDECYGIIQVKYIEDESSYDYECRIKQIYRMRLPYLDPISNNESSGYVEGE